MLLLLKPNTDMLICENVRTEEMMVTVLLNQNPDDGNDDDAILLTRWLLPVTCQQCLLLKPMMRRGRERFCTYPFQNRAWNTTKTNSAGEVDNGGGPTE